MRRWSGVGAVVLVLAGLSACSDDKAAGLPGPQEAGRGEKVDVDAFLAQLEDSFGGGTAARVTFDIAGPTRIQGRGVVEYETDGMNVDLRISDWQAKGSWIYLRTLDGATYMKVPESRGLWVDFGEAGNDLADSVLVDADPRTHLSDDREEISEVRFSGDEEIAGVDARRYQVLSEAASGATAAADAAPDVTQYWFDPDGRVIRRSSDLGEGTVRFSWVDWDSGATVTAPPADRVITLQQLERLRRKQAGDS